MEVFTGIWFEARYLHSYIITVPQSGIYAREHQDSLTDPQSMLWEGTCWQQSRSQRQMVHNVMTSLNCRKTSFLLDHISTLMAAPQHDDTSRQVPQTLPPQVWVWHPD